MEIYHVLNRGVDKRQIFMDKQDHLRFIHDLYEFNSKERTELNFYKFRDYELAGRTDIRSKDKEESLVDILAYCLMPNHYHLILQARVDSGIPQFMKKLNAGYAKYFNKKYERVGTLFQGRYKQILITDETHFLHLPFYIHLNPLDLSYPEWRENKMSNPERALGFLRSYRWSSHLDYLGIKNFPSVLNKEYLLEIFGSNKDYEKMVRDYLKDIQINEEIVLE